MNRLLLLGLAGIIALSLSACQQASEMEASAQSTANLQERVWTEEDRAYLLEHLDRTKQALLAATANLTAEQWYFKPDATAWSIAEIVEHLGLIEAFYFRDFLYGQYSPERRDLLDEVMQNDEALIAYAGDPSTANAAMYSAPMGRFDSGEALMDYFVQYRDQVLDLIETTESDFRLHYAYRAPGSGIWTARDLHQYGLTLIAHTERHTNQLNRNKSAAGYPRN